MVEISVTFLLEGILLLLVAVVGLIGNVVCFTTICRQKVQKLFHNLLLLLTTFDMVILDYSIEESNEPIIPTRRYI